MLVYFVMDAHICFTHMGVPSNLGAVLERARVQSSQKEALCSRPLFVVCCVACFFYMTGCCVVLWAFDLETCVQRETSSVAVITTLQELLRVEAADPGTDLLAEYVASRCGIKLRSSLFLKKADPVWHVRRGRWAVTTPPLLEDACQITFCHRVTKEKVKGRLV